MSDQHVQDKSVEAFWREMLTNGVSVSEQRWQKIFKHIPGDPRCKLCHSPFGGIGGSVMKIINRGPSNITTKLCGY